MSQNLFVAHLFGIQQYDNLSPIAAVPHDLTLMESALEAVGYEVKRPPQAQTLNQLKNGFKKALQSAPAKSTAILYFSGHGIHGRILPGTVQGAFCPAPFKRRILPGTVQEE